MVPIDREQEPKALRQRRQAIAEAWYQAIGQTSYVPDPAEEVRARLSAWVDELISLLGAETLDVERAEKVGVALAQLHLMQADALGGTLDVLGRALVYGLPGGEAVGLPARLAKLLGAVATGWSRQLTATILAEQEQTRNALVSELRATEQQVRRARDQLETRVQERTAELAQANEVLRAEIAERQRAEEALQESEERWRSLVESAPDIVVTVDRAGRVLFVNRLPESAGITAELLTGANVYNYVSADQQPALREALAAAFEGQRGLYVEMAVPRFGGATTWLALRLGPVWQGGRVSSVISVIRDISQEKQIQELKDNMIRDVSHELRSPLAKVQMSLDMLASVVESQPLDRERAARIYEFARRNVHRLLQTVEGILDLTRLESGVWPRDGQTIDLGNLLVDVVEHMAPTAKSKNLRLRVEVPDGPLPVVEGNWDRLFRALANLVDNAVKFTAEGEVVVSVVRRDGAVEFVVADTGEGMEAEVLDRVFERFYQARSQDEGIGIGLTICKAVVEAHGGRIWGESPGRGQGATFRFSLPVQPEGGNA